MSNKNFHQLFTETQNSLDKLFTWFSDNQLSLNIGKTCYSIFTNKQIPNNHLSINGTTLNRVQSVRFLGIYLDEKLTFETHVNHVCNSIMKLTGALNYISRFIHKDNALQIYYAYIYPHITYGIEVFVSCPEYVWKRLQSTLTKLLKILLKKGFRESASAIFRDTNLLKFKQIYEYF